MCSPASVHCTLHTTSYFHLLGNATNSAQIFLSPATGDPLTPILQKSIFSNGWILQVVFTRCRARKSKDRKRNRRRMRTFVRRRHFKFIACLRPNSRSDLSQFCPQSECRRWRASINSFRRRWVNNFCPSFHCKSADFDLSKSLFCLVVVILPFRKADFHGHHSCSSFL